MSQCDSQKRAQRVGNTSMNTSLGGRGRDGSPTTQPSPGQAQSSSKFAVREIPHCFSSAPHFPLSLPPLELRPPHPILRCVAAPLLTTFVPCATLLTQFLLLLITRSTLPSSVCHDPLFQPRVRRCLVSGRGSCLAGALGSRDSRHSARSH